jgi:hypothetical protein
MSRRRASTSCSPPSACACRSTRWPRSPSKPIPAPSTPGRFAAFRAGRRQSPVVGIQSFNERISRPSGASTAAPKHRRRRSAAHPLRGGQPRPDVRPARPEPGRSGSRSRHGLALAPQHLSCYHLTLEPNTAFAANPPTIPDPDACADMQEAIEARLAAPAMATTRPPPSPAPTGNAGTTSTTGPSATTSASAPAPTAS